MRVLWVALALLPCVVGQSEDPDNNLPEIAPELPRFNESGDPWEPAAWSHPRRDASGARCAWSAPAFSDVCESAIAAFLAAHADQPCGVFTAEPGSDWQSEIPGWITGE